MGCDPYRRLSAIALAVAVVSVTASPRAQFTPVSSMQRMRVGFALTELCDHRWLATGGGTAAAEIFDEASNRWEITAAMSTARSWHTAIRLNDCRVLVARGQRNAGTRDSRDP